jgi:hypothetical protein
MITTSATYITKLKLKKEKKKKKKRKPCKLPDGRSKWEMGRYKSKEGR